MLFFVFPLSIDDKLSIREEKRESNCFENRDTCLCLLGRRVNVAGKGNKIKAVPWYIYMQNPISSHKRVVLSIKAV